MNGSRVESIATFLDGQHTEFAVVLRESDCHQLRSL